VKYHCTSSPRLFWAARRSPHTLRTHRIRRSYCTVPATRTAGPAPSPPPPLASVFCSMVSQSCRRSSRMSCMLAFMTKDNHQALVEVNAAVAAPTGEEPLEVESGGVEGEREARLMRRATVVPTWKSEFSFACCMYMFLLYCHVFLVRYDQEAGTRWWPFWWANPRGGGGWMRSRPRTAVCVRNWRSHAFHSRIPLTHADGFK